MLFVEDLDHLLEAGTWIVDNVVGKQHGEGLVADEFARHEDRMTQAEGFFLTDVGDVHHVGDSTHDLQQIFLPALFEHALEFVADIEVIFDGLLAASSDDEDLVAAGGHGFFNAILDDRLIHQWEHFFGLGFGCGQEARAQAGSGENGFADFHLLHRDVRW